MARIWAVSALAAVLLFAPALESQAGVSLSNGQSLTNNLPASADLMLARFAGGRGGRGGGAVGVRGPRGGGAVGVRGPRGGVAVGVRGPRGGAAVGVRGPYGGRAVAGAGRYRVGSRYYGGVWYGAGVRRFYAGRWWPYGVGTCWRTTPIGFVWVCG
jgi:hypothetical protein